MHRCFRAGAVGAAFAIVGTPPLASAHVALETREAPANSTYKAVLGVPHGCGGDATHTVRVELPEGFIDVKPMPKAGWRLTTRSGGYARSYDLHGRSVSEGVKEIVWDDGSLPDTFYDEFVFRGRLTGFVPGTVLHFKTTQTCSGGEAAWTEIAADGQPSHELRHPAPTLLIAADVGNEGGHGAHAHGGGDRAGTASLGAITIEGAFARPSLGKTPNSAAYMTLGTSGTADRLVKVGSPVAEVVELHSHTTGTDGVMRMRPVEALPVEPDGPTRLQSGGSHVMLMGLKAPLEAGTTIPLTLTFEKAGEITIDVPVGEPADAPDDRHGNHGTSHSR